MYSEVVGFDNDVVYASAGIDLLAVASAGVIF
jgi:hypothetical protein